MAIPVIAFAYLDGEPMFKFRQCHRGLLFARIVFSLTWVSKGRSWQKMNASHYRANQPFDMPAKMRRGDGPKVQIDAVFSAASA